VRATPGDERRESRAEWRRARRSVPYAAFVIVALTAALAGEPRYPGDQT
jgi:hypothetical protein